MVLLKLSFVTKTMEKMNYICFFLFTQFNLWEKTFDLNDPDFCIMVNEETS